MTIKVGEDLIPTSKTYHSDYQEFVIDREIGSEEKFDVRNLECHQRNPGKSRNSNFLEDSVQNSFKNHNKNQQNQKTAIKDACEIAYATEKFKQLSIKLDELTESGVMNKYLVKYCDCCPCIKAEEESTSDEENLPKNNNKNSNRSNNKNQNNLNVQQNSENLEENRGRINTETSFKNPAYSKDEIENNTAFVGGDVNDITENDDDLQHHPATITAPVNGVIQQQPRKNSNSSSSSSNKSNIHPLPENENFQSNNQNLSKNRPMSVKEKLESMGAVPLHAMSKPDQLSETPWTPSQNREGEDGDNAGNMSPINVNEHNNLNSVSPGHKVLNEVTKQSQKSSNHSNVGNDNQQVLVETESDTSSTGGDEVLTTTL